MNGRNPFIEKKTTPPVEVVPKKTPPMKDKVKKTPPAQDESKKTNLDDFVDQNLENIVEYQLRAEKDLDQQQRVIEMLTRNVGRPRFLYGLLLIVILWIAFQQLLAMFGMRPPDPSPFNWLQGLISLTALAVTVMVLIMQNRQAQYSEHRRHLDLQVNLLVEQKVTKVIALLEELRRDLPSVHDRVDRQAEALQEIVDPQEILRALQNRLDDTPPE